MNGFSFLLLFEFIIIPERIGTIGKTHGVNDKSKPKTIKKKIFTKILFDNNFSYIFSVSDIFVEDSSVETLSKLKLNFFVIGG